MRETDQLLSELKKGSEQAYERLFYSYYADLVLYTNGILKNRELAEDLVQELFISFWADQKYRFIDSGLEGYLFRSARNTCLNYIRDEKRRSGKLQQAMSEVVNDRVPVVDEGEAKQEREEIYKALHRLPEQCKRIFILCCLEGLTYQQTADRLGISINTVRTQMGRAFRFLRDALRGKSFSSILFFFYSKLLNPKSYFSFS